MKKALLIMASAIIPFVGIAQDAVQPKWVKNVYGLKLSPNGKWIGSRAGDASIYNVETGEDVPYDGCLFGLGNTIANNGVGVASTVSDDAAVLVNGRVILPPTLSKYLFCNLNAITPDCTRIAGIISNPKRGASIISFVASIDENGNVGEPVFLPYPEKDFFGSTPQYSTAVWMSNDGKTLVGQVVDWRGMYTYPIIYKEDENGEWSYILPTEKMFNPQGIELPVNPWLSEPAYPEVADYIQSPIWRQAYLEAYERFSTGGGPWPNPYDYFETAEERQAYDAALAVYEKWAVEADAAIREYQRIYLDVLRTTPSFSQNDFAMHPLGEYFVTQGGVIDNEGEMIPALYKFDTNSKDGEYTLLSSPGASYYPHLILTNGTLVVTKPMNQMPSSMILLPGSEKFISVKEYFQDEYPEVAKWIDESFYGSGVLSMNEDMDFFVSALMPDLVPQYDWNGDNDFYYSSYMISLNKSGVESLEAELPSDGIYRIYTIQGVKVLETQDASEIDALPKGIYIINGKKVVI